MKTITTKARIRGQVRAVLYNADGSIAYESDWSDNLIVDNGLVLYGWAYWMQWGCIGSGGTPPLASDVTLEAFMAQVGGNNAMPYVDYPRPPVGPDWARYSVRKYRFGPGVGTGTVREFGIAYEHSSANLFARHLLPTPIEKNADQTLDMFYKFTCMIDSTPMLGQVVIKGVTYDCEMKPVNRDGYNTDIFAAFTIGQWYQPNIYDDTGEEGTDLLGPTGNVKNHGNSLKSFYVSASGQGFRDYVMVAGIGGWQTVTNEIRYVLFSVGASFKIQLKFTAVDGPDIGGPVPVDETEEVMLQVRVAWDRV